ncbi:LPS export ABC transporter periplasmic protein LptC [Treponema parvum]|uniref:LPS export ABC transporter periplasmic protein LptC n=1 Tax=Treponema parvum TaxID=138851 RepID=A0A975F2S0_9SPIR|nr:LPS export ABC transporter periplasmic protein LptC [Treponema parvum]QTQ13459.1 LPS export ABC transporter periplasmic protein LptC [Treponema parvum]
MKELSAAFAVIFMISLSACSLNYANGMPSADDFVPEIVFTDAKFYRIENSKKSLDVYADKIEQYKKGAVSYAENIKFASYDGDEKINSEGSCSLLSADSQKKEYILLGDIIIKNHPQKTTISAQSVRWNADSQQLTGGKDEVVTLVRDDITLKGRGFSASAVSNGFSFSGETEGTIVTGSATGTAETSDGFAAVNADKVAP